MSTTEAKLRHLRIIDLKELLVKKGLPVSGKKEELIARILATEDKKPEDITNQSKDMDISATSINFISNNDNTQMTIKTESKNGSSDPYGIETAGLDDWDKFTTEDIANLSKESDFDFPTSPSFSVASNKEFTSDKEKAEVSKENYKKPDEKNDTFKTLENDTKSDILVKPSGFTCKKIVFDEEPTSQVAKPQSNLAAELERRKKRAERFGIQLSDADKKLQRAARFGIEASIPIDSPLKDEEKLRKRAEKFGLDNVQVKSPNSANSLSEEEKKRKRTEKFETEVTASSTATPDFTPTPLNPSSLSTLSEEERKKRRAERFAMNSAESSSKKLKT
ncbi:9728_t:CDS:2 [Acaulospora colombiana]|uniref:9728_t:CDS:1 n=1 Tax=Acaulospora colombiana TaxID=27376 RepID=A0ACA9KD49_9GLOM|nr:9728_t:CDS:2 [Acaulospora colombiana]